MMAIGTADPEKIAMSPAILNQAATPAMESDVPSVNQRMLVLVSGLGNHTDCLQIFLF
jgi:hypothetical protein